MSYNNEDDQGSEPYERNDELLPSCAVDHIDHNFGSVEDQQGKDYKSIDTEEGGGDVINIFEPGVIVIDEQGVQQVSKQ